MAFERHPGVCCKTAWLTQRRLMVVMRVREEGLQLDGLMEIDGACRGGERMGGKVGRGAENTVPFVAAMRTTPDGKPQFMCLRLQPLNGEDLAVCAPCSSAPSATVVSGGLSCLGAVQIVSATHGRVVTGSGKASADLPQFRAINTVLANLGTALRGTGHAFDFARHAHRYLAEAQYRINRRFDPSASLVRRPRAACLTIPNPRRRHSLIRPQPPGQLGASAASRDRAVTGGR